MIEINPEDYIPKPKYSNSFHILNYKSFIVLADSLTLSEIL